MKPGSVLYKCDSYVYVWVVLSINDDLHAYTLWLQTQSCVCNG